jgi:fructan beta-fructosidase
MFYLNGKYNLFYQYYPNGITWGPMHWGHAISTDLVHWKKCPIALYPDKIGMIFSGSAVVDINNTSGFKTNSNPPVVAIFTHNTSDNVQEQSIAYSNDNGMTWKKYNENPVIPNPGLHDFRDPKVFWYEPSRKWILVLAQKDRVKIYTSPNLKKWTFASDFGENDGAHMGVWECPDLFPLKVDGGTKTKWVMLVSVSADAPAGGSGTQYFTGDFDGTKFKNDSPEDTQWIDYGADNYAGVTWSNIPAADGRRVFIGWMNNWSYATTVPTDPGKTWRSSMTVPRNIELKIIDGKAKLVQTPVKELNTLRETGVVWNNQIITPGKNILSSFHSKQCELVAEFRIDNTTATEFGFKVRKGKNQYTSIYYDKANSQVKIDRMNSGSYPTIINGFPAVHSADISTSGDVIKMRILVDWASVELFANDGQIAMTDTIFPKATSDGLELFSVGGKVTLKSLIYYPLKSATPKNIH